MNHLASSETKWTQNLVTLLMGFLVVFSLLAGSFVLTEPAAAENTDINIGYVNWASAEASTYVAEAVLEKRMDLNINLTMVDVGPVYTGLAEGDIDAFLAAWLPGTHKSYVEKFKDEIVKTGANFIGAKIGLVVPEYVDIDSIKELNANAEKFDNKIVGIDSGAGIMKATRKAIKHYNLDLKLISSSGPAMTAALKDAISNKEWVVVTGWKPHWKFAKWDLKFLKDPAKLYGTSENIYSFLHPGFSGEYPRVASFLHDFRMSSQQLGQVMGWIAEGTKPKAAAKRWVEENEKVVDSWLNPADVSQLK